MQISNRLLVGIAIVSGLATMGLVYSTPSISPIRVLEATEDIPAWKVLNVGSNLKDVPVSFRTFSNSKNLIPASMTALVDGRHCAISLASGNKLTLDHVIPGKRTTQAGDAEEELQRFFQLSGLLAEQPGVRAIAVNSDALVSVGNALEPGDYIDIVFPTESPEAIGVHFPHLKVLAVGGRAQGGWVTQDEREEQSDTITLAVPEAQVSSLAAKLAFAGMTKPRTVLHPRRQGE